MLIYIPIVDKDISWYSFALVSTTVGFTTFPSTVIWEVEEFLGVFIATPPISFSNGSVPVLSCVLFAPTPLISRVP